LFYVLPDGIIILFLCHAQLINDAEVNNILKKQNFLGIFLIY